MKRIYLISAVLLLCVHLAIGQSQDVRTNKTIVADVLAQLPASNQENYNKYFADLASTGEEGVMMLIDMIESAGQNGNVPAEYAISGLSAYVTSPGKESLRQTIASAYMKGLDKVDDKQIKLFLIRQLQLAGKDDSVDKLATYIGLEDYSDDVTRALASIGTDKAVEALKRSLLSRMNTKKTLMNAIRALGDVATINTEDLLLPMVGDTDENLERTILYTLSRTGTSASLKVLADAAAKAGYKYEKEEATAYYIDLVKRISEQGNTREAEKAASDLLKQATKTNQLSLRIAANEVLFQLQSQNATKKILADLKDKDREYRNASLAYASTYADPDMYVQVFKELKKARPETKIDILKWIAREAKCPEKNKILKGLEVRFDVPGEQVLINEMQRIIDQLDDSSFEVTEAAVWALTTIGNKSSLPVVADLLTHKNEKIILLAQKALESFPGDIESAVVAVMPKANDTGKIAAMQLLAIRKADGSKNMVYNQLTASSPSVKEAAYAALKEVVTDKDFVRLAGLLETADAGSIKPLQEAIISAISTLPADQQAAMVNSRMIQAGESKKHLYYTVLASTGDQKALNTILDGFKGGKGVAKDQAFEALLQWRGPEVIDELYSICNDPSGGTYFDRALTAYVNLVSAPAITGENRLLGLRKAMGIAKTNEQKNDILQRIQRTDTFLAMIYAGEFLNEKPVQQAAAQAVMNIALNHKEYTGTVVRNLLQKTASVLDNPDAGYQREAINKHLAEMPQEEGFVSIFNGKDLTGWKGLVGNPLTRAKMNASQLAAAQKKADEQMRKDWKVEDGYLVFDGAGYDNLCTVKQYGDIEMYVDWMLDTSGKEADAGIYLRGTPQVQIWDISRVNVGAQVGSGGLYNNQTHESKPSKVADNKMGEWNTFYIKMVGDRVTVVLNGEKVVDDVILENYWDRKLPIFPVEQLELQAHGSKVYYRDIYVKELPRTEPFQLSAQEKKEGYKILFDGSNMHEWTGNTVDYTMQDGTISLVPSRGSGGNLYTKKEYGNFIFRFEFQLTPAANNGLGIRTPMEGDAAYVGMELQILDDDHPVYKDLEIYQYHGSVYGIIPAERGHLKPMGEWNYQEVIANGDHIKITLNGEVILDGNIRQATKNGTLDKKEHPGLFNKKGYIAFLGHGSPVKFRNIRIKELK